jgi:structural maintenance of chromosomes protein 6
MLCMFSVLFDHKAKTLTIISQTDNLSNLTKCNDMRQMSGGERSYTTLCLLMALGHVVECPFRLMDEYDVFLDQISREITLKEIQKYALGKEQKGRQFIVLTPQSLDSVVTTNEVRVHRIRSAERISARGPRQALIDDPQP